MEEIPNPWRREKKSDRNEGTAQKIECPNRMQILFDVCFVLYQGIPKRNGERLRRQSDGHEQDGKYPVIRRRQDASQNKKRNKGKTLVDDDTHQIPLSALQ